MSNLSVKINSARKSSEYLDVKSITLPSSQGEIEVLPEHMSLITELNQGKVVLEMDHNQNLDLFVSGGYARVRNNEVNLLLDEVDLADELVEEEIKQAITNAEEMIADSDLPPAELIQLEKRLRYERFKLHQVARV